MLRAAANTAWTPRGVREYKEGKKNGNSDEETSAGDRKAEAGAETSRTVVIADTPTDRGAAARASTALRGRRKAGAARRLHEC